MRLATLPLTLTLLLWSGGTWARSLGPYLDEEPPSVSVVDTGMELIELPGGDGAESCDTQRLTEPERLREDPDISTIWSRARPTAPAR